MNEILILGALFSDLLLGDPKNFPHPIRWIGNLISAIDSYFFKRKMHNKTTGFFLLFLTVGITTGMTAASLKIALSIHEVLWVLISIALLHYTIAIKDLADHVKDVQRALAKKDLPEARKKLSWIVGRDTENLVEKDIHRACIETLSESYIDGIITPLFYAFLGGPLLAMGAKSINTLDSMVGYKNEKYAEFGFFSAKADDLINWIPARIGPFFLLLAALILNKNYRKGGEVFWRDRLKHPSPNSAHGEACMAGILEVELGGSSQYQGRISHKPKLGAGQKEPSKKEVQDCIQLIYGASLLFTLCFFFLSRIIHQMI